VLGCGDWVTIDFQVIESAKCTVVRLDALFLFNPPFHSRRPYSTILPLSVFGNPTTTHFSITSINLVSQKPPTSHLLTNRSTMGVVPMANCFLA
jgi:hypothetical protein